MYKEISAKLSEAKKSGDKNLIKESLLFLVSEIENTLNSSNEELINKLPFSNFIEDRDFIFKTDDQSIFNDEGADVNMSTNGLIIEMLNAYGISDGEKLSDNLKEAIFSLHANLSKGMTENEVQIKDLHLVLNNIKDQINEVL